MRFYLIFFGPDGPKVLADELTLSLCFKMLEAYAEVNKGIGTIACALAL
jgi:hypothetical protein